MWKKREPKGKRLENAVENGGKIEGKLCDFKLNFDSGFVFLSRTQNYCSIDGKLFIFKGNKGRINIEIAL